MILFLLQRVVGVLRLLMTYSEEVVQLACTETSYEILLEIIEVPCTVFKKYKTFSVFLYYTKLPQVFL
jgi:hypothetical protein